MRKILALAFLIISLRATAQDSLKVFNDVRNRTAMAGMFGLMSWGLTSLSVGGVGWAFSSGSQNHYFYQMTTIWGITNVAISVVRPGNHAGKTSTPAESLAEQEKLEKIFLVNGALDVVYIGTGFYLDSRGINTNDLQLKGYGVAIAVQGSFLLFFDAVMYRTLRGNGTRLRHFLEKTPITFTGKTIGIQLNI